MAAIDKGSPKITFQFVPSKRQSVLGGLPAVEALAQEFGLRSKLRAIEGRIGDHHAVHRLYLLHVCRFFHH